MDSSKSRKHFVLICIVWECLTGSLPGIVRVHAQDFGYDGDKGPNHWGEQYNTCFGKYQSPIDINSLAVKYAQLPALKFSGFDGFTNRTRLQNNGHTVMVTIDANSRPTISGGPLSGSYEFAQLHFHWGENDTFGSEDLIDGRSFPMELHMVFYKKQYRNIRSAMENTDGLCVLAFFFHVDDENTKYAEITALLSKILEPNMFASFERMKSVRDLILDDTQLTEYYTYHGSLTTPPCSEVVTWIDFKRSIPLSHAQIEVFRTIHDNEGHRLTHNFRPIQPLGDRDVYFVSSLNYPGKELDQDRMLEPSQHLDGPNALAKQNIGSVESRADESVETDRAPIVHHPGDSNELELETTTQHDRHFSKVANGRAAQIESRIVWAPLVSCGLFLLSLCS